MAPHLDPGIWRSTTGNERRAIFNLCYHRPEGAFLPQRVIFGGRESGEERNSHCPIPGKPDFSMIRQHRLWLRYGLATLAALVAFGLLLVLQGFFEDRTFTVLYVPVIMYAAFAGGAGPALFATALCLGISGFFLGTDLYAKPANLIDISLFAVLGPILGYIGNRLLHETEDARYRQAQLQSILDTVPEAMIVIDDHGLMRSFST